MRFWMLAAGGCLAAAAVGAEIRDESFVAGDQQIWIELIDPIEIMWVGPNAYERTQVLSGDDIEIAAFATDEASVRSLGVSAVVAEMPGTHSCENLGDPKAYYVVTIAPVLATDGPATACAPLNITVADNMIAAEEDPMRINTDDGGEFWIWVPGKGFENQPD